MATNAQSGSRKRFDTFDLDLRSGELWKDGIRVRLQEQPFQVLRLLLEHRGDIVTRDELKEMLWPGETFVDFDDGLNTAVKKIRDLLGDSAERPRYIETIPRRGYRFMPALEPTGNVRVEAQRDHAGQPVASPPSKPRDTIRRRETVLGAVVVTVALALSIWVFRFHSQIEPPHVRAIAVLPFENLSGNPSQDYFAAGLTDALTTELARTVESSLRVTSRVSAESFRNKPLAQVARDLDVDVVVEGSVIRSGNRARITAQLIDARADKHLWAASYDRDLHDILILQREIAATIVRQIRIRLTPKVQTRLASAPAVDPLAYDLYLRGRYRAFSNNRQDLAAATGFLEQAVQLEPNLAAAHALLARVYSTEAFLVQPKETELEEKAFDEVNQALKLDPDLPDAYLARGILDWTHRNGFPHERAIRNIKRAVELDPNLAEGHHELGKIFIHIGLLAKAEQELSTALKLEPGNMGVRYRIAVARLDEGRPQEAMRDLEGTRPFTPELWAYHTAFALFQLGRKQEAAILIRDYLRENPRDEGGVGSAIQALLYADAGKAVLSERSIETSIRNGKDFGHFHHAEYTIGAAYALMNRPQEAVRWLRAAADDGFPCYPLYARDHTLDALRTYPPFSELMADLDHRWEHYQAIF